MNSLPADLKSFAKEREQEEIEELENLSITDTESSSEDDWEIPEWARDSVIPFSQLNVKRFLRWPKLLRIRTSK